MGWIMKRIVPFVLILLALLILLFATQIFVAPPAPIFSHDSGYYQESFTLSISSNTQNSTIHYTLDGSIPNLESPVYIEPITIKDRSNEPNTISMIPTISYKFAEPEENLFKISTIRARSFNNITKAPSPIITKSFIVHQDIHNIYSLPVISLVVDPKDFFDQEKGIYVTGEEEEVIAQDGDYYYTWPANYHDRGEDSEKPVFVEYFDIDGKLQFAQNSGIRIHGFASRSYPQKSFRLYASQMYDTSDKFSGQIFPNLVNVDGESIDEFETLILRNGGTDSPSSFFRDALIQKLVEHTSVDTQAISPVVVFLNGEYWGLYFLYERYDEGYFLNHYGIQPENLLVLENKGVIVIGAEKERQVYQDLLFYVLENDPNNAAVYDEISNKIDIVNFIDYQITEIFIAHQDWPDNNIKYWRTRTSVEGSENSTVKDGRWRWLLFDTDHGFTNTELNSIEYATRTDLETILLRSLIKNPDFRNQFLNRFADHLNTSFKTERVVQEIDYFEALLEPEMQDQIDRWRSSGGSMTKWYENVEELRLFAKERPTIVIQDLIEFFDLSGSLTLTLTFESEKGFVKVNSIEILASTPGIDNPEFFQGIYFQDIPIEITAVPKEGYEFSHWQGAGYEGVEEESIVINSKTDHQLQPIFISVD